MIYFRENSIVDLVELLKQFDLGSARMFQILAIFSVQKGIVQMLQFTVETNMGVGGGTQKNSKLHFRWVGPLVTIH